MAKANSADRRFAGVKYRSDAHWDFTLQLNADDSSAFWNLLDERASWFYEAVGAGPAMAPKHPGPSSAYLGAYKDKAGKWPDGGTSYRLRVPAHPPKLTAGMPQMTTSIARRCSVRSSNSAGLSPMWPSSVDGDESLRAKSPTHQPCRRHQSFS